MDRDLEKIMEKQETDVAELNTLLRQCLSGLENLSHEFEESSFGSSSRRQKVVDESLSKAGSGSSSRRENAPPIRKKQPVGTPAEMQHHNPRSISPTQSMNFSVCTAGTERSQLKKTTLFAYRSRRGTGSRIGRPKTSVSTGSYSTHNLDNLAAPKRARTPLHVHGAIGMRPHTSATWNDQGRHVPLHKSSSFEVPGPGHYESSDSETALRAIGHRKGTAGHSGQINSGQKPPNELELILRARGPFPGPEHYNAGTPGTPFGGTISTAQTRSEFEWAIFRSNERPAPWAYHQSPPKTSGGRFNTANTPGVMDLAIARSRQSPGPGAYSLSGPSLRGGSFPRGEKLPDEIDLAARRAARIPGPADYSPASHRAPGGKLHEGECPKTDVEWMIYRAKRGPGPGSYRIPGVWDTGVARAASPWAKAKKTDPRDRAQIRRTREGQETRNTDKN